MKTITMYQADDGSRWNTPEAAEKRDWLVTTINTIDSLLPQQPIDKGCKFANGYGYLQCDPVKVSECKRLFTELVNQQAGTSYQAYDQISGRLLDDGYPVLYRFWGRLSCIDEQNRLWGNLISDYILRKVNK